MVDWTVLADKMDKEGETLQEVGKSGRFFVKGRFDGSARLAERVFQKRLIFTKNPSFTTAVFQVMDCRDIGRLDDKYNGIMCGFCLPYLSKAAAVKLINDAAQLLNPNGVFYLSTMEENEDNKSGLKTSSTGDQLYMYYHQAEYLTNALQENNFSIIDLRRQDYPTQDGTSTTDLIILAGKLKKCKSGNLYRCNRSFFPSSSSRVSTRSGSGTQQSTGHTAAHCGSSWKPTHSVHLSGTM